MKTPCRYPGCRALLDRSGYCERHAKAANASRTDYDRTRRRTDQSLAEAKRIRSSAAWSRVRRIKLTTSPLCEDPHGDHARAGRTATATQVHHIRPAATHPEQTLDLDNLMSVCTRCHARIEQALRK